MKEGWQLLQIYSRRSITLFKLDSDALINDLLNFLDCLLSMQHSQNSASALVITQMHLSRMDAVNNAKEKLSLASGISDR